MEHPKDGGPINAKPDQPGSGRVSGISVAEVADRLDSKNASAPQGKASNPLRSIRDKCIDCAGGSSKEVKLCTCNECALFPFRFGKNPFREKRTMTEEAKAKLAARLAAGRAVRHG